MIKTILAPLSGGDIDASVLDAAQAIARPFAAHIECFHSFVDAGTAAANMPSAAFLMGIALHNALDQFQAGAENRAAAARAHFTEFCARQGLAVADAPSVPAAPSASLHEDRGDSMRHFLSRAMRNDLVVMGRPHDKDGLPPDLLDRLLLQCGRPLLIVPPQPPAALLGTVMVCWKETAESARAVAAALPLLAQARQVVLAGVDEGAGDPAVAVQGLSRHLAWHGIRSAVKTLPAGGRPAMNLLWQAAAECDAGLLVMGAYSRSPTREHFFGGCTEAALQAGERPVFIVH